jgi:hypothetical protein
LTEIAHHTGWSKAEILEQLYPLELLDVQDAIKQQTALDRYQRALDAAMTSTLGEGTTEHMDALWRAVPGATDAPAGLIPDVFERDKLLALKDERASAREQRG